MPEETMLLDYIEDDSLIYLGDNDYSDLARELSTYGYLKVVTESNN